MKICINCGKEYNNQNKLYCSQKCRSEYLKNTRTCPICGKKFWASPSSKVVTCGQKCEAKNRAQIGKSESNIGLELAWKASAESPNSGSFDTNIHAKSWGLVSPYGNLYEVDNLAKWCREHTDLIPYASPKVFVTDLYKIKAGKISSAGGWTLQWWSESNRSREGMPEPKRHPKRTKMTDEERLARKRQRAKEYYHKKKRESSDQ